MIRDMGSGFLKCPVKIGRCQLRIPFETSVPGMFSLALEVQIIDQVNHALVCRGSEIISSLDPSNRASRRIRTGARQNFLEFVSSEHEHPAGLLAQMSELRTYAIHAALANQCLLSGGGAHAATFRMNASPVRSVDQVVDQELASPFYSSKVFVSVKSGDEAIRLIRLLTPYVPHLIALSASSPLMTDRTSGLACSRLLSRLSRGEATSLPGNVRTWDEFERYSAFMMGGMSDPTEFDWDMVPRPDLGAIEIRVMDASLTVQRACSLAGFVQALAQWVLRQDDPVAPGTSAHSINRAQACCFGLDADFVPFQGARPVSLRQEVLRLIDEVFPVADEIGSMDHIEDIAAWTQSQRADADWLRRQAGRLLKPEHMVQQMVELFDESQVCDRSAEMGRASDSRAFSFQRMQADQGFGPLVPNRLAPGMSVADFDRQL